MADKEKDNWSSSHYQSAAAFVPQLAGKVVQWLDVKEDDRVLDLGCGDGVLTNRLATVLTKGHIHGIDASASMLETAGLTAPKNTTYTHLDANLLSSSSSSLFPHTPTQEAPAPFTKIFSNAALHWILSPSRTRNAAFFSSLLPLVPQGTGTLVFEMGGLGNCADAHTALLSAVAKRVGLKKARDFDPWFFPGEKYMTALLEGAGWLVEKCEVEYRPTVVQKEGREGVGKDGKGGLEGWVRLMGAPFLEGLAKEGADVEEVVREVVDVLASVCGVPCEEEEEGTGELVLGYVRLRVKARRP